MRIRKDGDGGGTSLVVQWLRLCPSKAGGMVLILVGETKIPQASQHSQKLKKRDMMRVFMGMDWDIL